MGDLNKVVYFRAVADCCGTELTLVNTTSCSNLNTVSNLTRADLGDLSEALSTGDGR
jgi:hypothetical protein